MNEFDNGYNACIKDTTDFLNQAIAKYGGLAGKSGDSSLNVIQHAMITFCKNLRDMLESKKR